MSFLTFTEKEYSNPVLDTGEKISIAFITSDKGEALKETLISNETDLISKFGYPNTYNQKLWWNCWNYLQYASNLKVFRIIDETSSNYSLLLKGKPNLSDSPITTNITNNSGVNLYNFEKANISLINQTNDTFKLEVFNKFVSKANNTCIAICSHEEDFTKTIFEERILSLKAKEVSAPLTTPKEGEKYAIYKEKLIILGIKVLVVGLVNQYYLIINGNHPIASGDYISILNTPLISSEDLNGKLQTVSDSIYDSVSNTTSIQINLPLFDTRFPPVSTRYADISLSSDNDSLIKSIIDLNSTKQCDVFIESDYLSFTTGQIITYELDDDGNKTVVSTSNPVDEGHISVKYVLNDQDQLRAVYKYYISFTNISVEYFDVIDEGYIEYMADSFNPLINTNISNHTIIYYNGTSWIDFVESTDEIYQLSETTNGYKTYIENISKTFEFTIATSTWNTLDNENYIPYRENGVTLYATNNIFENRLFTSSKRLKTFKEICSKTPNFSDDEFVILVFNKNSEDVFELKEEFIGTYKNEINLTGYNQFIETKINGISNYIYIKVYESGDKVSTFGLNSEYLTITDNSSNDYSNVSDFQTFNNFAVQLEDKDKYDFDFLIGFECTDNESKTYNIFPEVARVREDCLAIISPFTVDDFLGLSDQNINEKMKQSFSQNYFGEYFTSFSTYSAVYANMKLMYDKFNNVNFWCPITGDVVGLITNCVKLYGESVAPAGVVKTKLKNISGLLYSPSDSLRKELTSNGINPVIFETTSQSFSIFESLTSINNINSKFRNIHIRLFLNSLKKYLKTIALEIMFNSQNITPVFVKKINLYLKEKISANQIEFGKAAIGTVTNDEINQGITNIDLYIKFYNILRQINFIIYVLKDDVVITEI